MNDSTEDHTISKVDASQGDEKRLNYNVLIWSVALVIGGFVAAYFLA